MSSSSPKQQIIINRLVDLIQQSEYGEAPMQYLLVKFGGRKAYLLETSEYGRETVDALVKLAKQIGLRVSKDRLGREDAPRYLIHSNHSNIKRLPQSDEELGALLGFKNPGGDFGDSRHSRTVLTISTTEETCRGGCIGASTTEMVKGNRAEIEAFAERKVRAFNQVMIHLQLPYRFEYSIEVKDGSWKRAQELERLNMKYIRANKRLYKEDLWNELNGDNDHPFIILFDQVCRKRATMEKYVSFYSYFYQLIHDEKIRHNNKVVVKRLNQEFLDLLRKEFA